MPLVVSWAVSLPLIVFMTFDCKSSQTNWRTCVRSRRQARRTILERLQDYEECNEYFS